MEDDHPGFDYKWNQGWTKDFLDYLSRDPLERKEAHDQLTLSMIYAYSEHYILTLGTRDVGSLENFMERLPGNTAQKIAQVKAAYTYLTLHPGCKMTAPDREVTGELAAFIGDLNGLYRSHPALYEKDDDYDGFEWIQLMKYEENVPYFPPQDGQTGRDDPSRYSISREFPMRNIRWECPSTENIRKSSILTGRNTAERE